MPNARALSVSREEPESEVASSSRNSPASVMSEQLPFLIFDETIKIFQNSVQQDADFWWILDPPLNT